MHAVLASAMMPLLRLMDPETSHNLALSALAAGLGGRDTTPPSPRLAVQAMGLDFANPIGIAAGFDKNARAIRPLARLGFGFVEAGTVTPRPQEGNVRPRLFRLAEDRAVVNRMGFNNEGLAGYVPRLAAARPAGVPVGANVGINKDGADPERDYPALVAAVAPHCDYVVVNISSPNTPGLRDLQGEERLRGILRAIAAGVPVRPKLLVKVAPDLSEDGLRSVADTALEEGVDGLIVSNTTIRRPPGLRSANAHQAGGLSGAPLRPFAQAALLAVARHVASRGAATRLTLIGVGGIATGEDILARIRAGASLVQLYTEFAYAGPALVPRLKRELLAAMDRQGISCIADAIGADLEAQ